MKKKQLYELILELQKRVAVLEKSTHSHDGRPFTVIGDGTKPIEPAYAPFMEAPAWCLTLGQHHTYPLVWNSTTPPACLRCGWLQPQPYITYTVSSQDGVNSATGSCPCGSECTCASE